MDWNRRVPGGKERGKRGMLFAGRPTTVDGSILCWDNGEGILCHGFWKVWFVPLPFHQIAQGRQRQERQEEGGGESSDYHSC